MGVPKFFRYISERYPCLSEFVQEHQIPEFDNLYLDMNGIIHNCSHPDDGNPHFRITEEKIFADIFHYIETLFNMIKPQKLFFMAVDGVAPRAKMNQQRGRRFRSAKDAQKQEEEAQKRGELLPEEARFDSNCITPGTEFMAKLHDQLQYLVTKKISQDPMWQRCQVILSGHETPGEGEHKIMDYIRYMRSKPDYDPNTRHCLYGLDADLIMLGLCTHDPHFSLLREEVKFGKKATKKTGNPEDNKFFLLHLSLMREYLEMEFSPLKKTLTKFSFNIENIIDDWVLMGFLVGNDFIPNLPNLHITNGALPLLFKVYMETLPQLDGYINEAGILNLQRFEIFMKKLGEIDEQNFEEVKDDLEYMRMKTGRRMDPFFRRNTKQKNVETLDNDELLELFDLSDDKPTKDSGLNALINATEEEYLDDDEGETSEEDCFKSYKKSYYMNKLEYDEVNEEVMKSQAVGYIRAIQWNLHYYYNGVCSWSWYYPHHYSPYISDIKDFGDLKLEYDIGTPFKPYEQLLAVLPAASKQLLPQCYQNLMTSEDSPLKHYYPEDFQTDLNGKKQEWEAVVLVPFIDEIVLLDAMRSCDSSLTPAEIKRNIHSPMLSYTYTKDNLGVYSSPMYFKDVMDNHALVRQITVDEIRVPLEKLVKGAYPGAQFDVFYPGFPTMKHLHYKGHLKKARVKVFEQPSREESMIIELSPSDEVSDTELPVGLLNETVHINWPHLMEAKVVAVCDSKDKHVFVDNGNDPLLEQSPSSLRGEIERIREHYYNRLGIELGEISTLIEVKQTIGKRYMYTNSGRFSLNKIFSDYTTYWPLQLIVKDIKVVENQSRNEYSIEEAFPLNSECFIMTHNEFYGNKSVVTRDDRTPQGRICVNVTIVNEPDLTKIRNLSSNTGRKYMSLYRATNQLDISNMAFSRITGTYFATVPSKDGTKCVNLGLDLKLNKKNLETPGYTKKIDNTWFYTRDTIDLVHKYMEDFPEVFTYMKGPQKEQTMIEDIFPDEPLVRLKELQTWLKSQPHVHVNKITCDTKTLEDDFIKNLEEIIDNHRVSGSSEVIMHCPPTFLYKPDLCFGNLLPDHTVTVNLLDRVVHVKKNHIVPYGLRGTVISIHKVRPESSEYLYDIMFDDAFKGGMEMNCSSPRCYRLPLFAFINISHGSRLYQPRVQKFTPLPAKQDDRKMSYNRNYSDGSAFAKFTNQYQSVPKSYRAVPPLMANGEPLYKPFVRQSNHHIQTQKAIPKRQLTTTARNRNQHQKVQHPQQRIDFMPSYAQKENDIMQTTSEALKRILKIAPSTTTNLEPNTGATPKVVPQQRSAVHKTNQGNTTNANALPATMRLINLYKSKNLGLPKYNYLSSKYGLQAQIKLPNDQVIVTKVVKTKEEASELAANQVLTIHNLEPTKIFGRNVNMNSTNNFPIPPQQWRQAPQKVDNHATKEGKKNCQPVHNNINPSWQGMIPLQVVKKGMASASSKPTNIRNSNSGPPTNVNEEHKISTNKKVTEKDGKTTKKSVKKRKMRIAANFENTQSS